jgi:hypothetical protein
MAIGWSPRHPRGRHFSPLGPHRSLSASIEHEGIPHYKEKQNVVIAIPDYLMYFTRSRVYTLTDLQKLYAVVRSNNNSGVFANRGIIYT